MGVEGAAAEKIKAKGRQRGVSFSQQTRPDSGAAPEAPGWIFYGVAPVIVNVFWETLGRDRLWLGHASHREPFLPEGGGGGGAEPGKPVPPEAPSPTPRVALGEPQPQSPRLYNG